MAPLSLRIIRNAANDFGFRDDIQVIERLCGTVQDILKQTIQKPILADMREPLIHCDIQIHLEIPVFGAVPFAFTNIMLVNPEQWSYAYDAYVHAFDALLFRDTVSMEQFRVDFLAKGLPVDRLYAVPWADAWQVKDATATIRQTSPINGFLALLGGSTSKAAYVKQLLPHWLPADPPLTVYTTRTDVAEQLRSITNATNITIHCKELKEEERQSLLGMYRGHLIVSQGEAFGYAAAHAETVGAFALMNRLPVFEALYGDSKGVAWLSNSYEASTKVRYALASPSPSLVRTELDQAFCLFTDASAQEVRKVRQGQAAKRMNGLTAAAAPLFQQLQALVLTRKPKGIYHCPPILEVKDCPPITIVTPTYNRKKLIDIAFHNLLATDYPQKKIEWIVIEDNEKTPHMVGEKVMDFQIKAPEIAIKYIPIEGRMTIGEKRNHAIEHASHDIILFMDDDDHYPTTSFRRRVAWLVKGKKGAMEASIACCTTLALYDLKRGVSAVNVPPFDIPFAQRISEATLTFFKSAWLTRRFPHVSLAEGENWIQGREDQVIEIPPQQIIVAFTHGENQSSRRIPPVDQKPSCFWGFPKEYLEFIHGLVGVGVEEDKKVPKKK